MNRELLKSLYSIVTDYDADTILAIYDSQGKHINEIISGLPCPLPEENIRGRYFRLTKDDKYKSFSFSYFMLKGGFIYINPRKAEELNWLLSVNQDP